MNTNYFGAVRCIKAVLPGMREARKGCIRAALATPIPPETTAKVIRHIVESGTWQLPSVRSGRSSVRRLASSHD